MIYHFQLGKAEGIITVLRGVPHNASRLRKVYLPVSALTDYQVSSESIIRNTFDKDQMQNLVESMASIADEHLTNARFRSKYLSKKEKLVLLPAVTADRWFSRYVHFLSYSNLFVYLFEWTPSYRKILKWVSYH